MTITPGQYKSYDPDRMSVLFTMLNGGVEIICAISTAAMDDLENTDRGKASQREAQFMRLRERIERQAAGKIARLEFEGAHRGVVLRTVDFRP